MIQPLAVAATRAGLTQALGTDMKIPVPVIVLSALSTAGMLLAFGFNGFKSALFLATGNLILIIWAMRNPQLARHWKTSLFASAPILLLTVGCIYLLRVQYADALTALALFFYWLVHLVMLAISFGIARAYHESSVSPRA